MVNEGKVFESDLLIEDSFIKSIQKDIVTENVDQVFNAKGKYLLPGVIDEHVHFREPGLTRKGDIESESKAALAGGVTSFIDQPNTNPHAVTLPLVEEKYQLAAAKSYANYGFSIGATNSNLSEILKCDPQRIPAVKLFLCASTGDMEVNDPVTIEGLFRESPLLICVHSEDHQIIKANFERYKAQYGDDIPPKIHPLIRSTAACVSSTNRVVDLAERTKARIHIYHVSTGAETELFKNDLPLAEKRITAETCPHFLHFTDWDYATKGMLIKWNPAIKTTADQEALWKALLDDRIDTIGTDHAPHTWEEKQNIYTKCPSGAPLVQHSLPLMLEFFHQRKISLEKIVEKMCHNPATLFRIEKRGFLREGYKADLVLVAPDSPWKVAKENILYKCGWSPLEGLEFHHQITHTFVNGKLAYGDGSFADDRFAERLSFRN